MLVIEDRPTYQLLPLLRDEEYQALKADIAERGVLVPVEVDEAGNILDGHHRVTAWQELRAEGVRVKEYERLIRVGLTEEQKRNHVRALNLLRRHLSKEQLSDQMKAMRQDGASLQEIAKAVGVSRENVRCTVGEQLATNGKLDAISTPTKGKDGKVYPRNRAPRKPATVLATSAKEQERAQVAIAQAGESLPDHLVTVKRAERIAREQSVEMHDDTQAGPLVSTNLDLRLGDFREALASLPDESVDLIFTDPPYPKEYLPLWSPLAQLAARVLKPGGLLVAYSGQYHLPAVMHSLAEHLEYVWLGGLFTPGQHNQVQQKHVRSGMKPLLFYARTPYQPGPWIEDAYASEERIKEDHEWQQSIGCARHYIGRLTAAGDTVVDPFLGSGTTAAAAHELGRSFIGSEVDPVAMAAVRRRLAG